MLDETREKMLNIAMLLTADDLDQIRTGANGDHLDATERVVMGGAENAEGVADVEAAVEGEDAAATNGVHSTTATGTARPSATDGSGLTMGERERLRTRESKVSTTCVGQPREAHEWWPVGTALEGRIGNEVFDASVVSNPRVKSGRSILIDSGPAQGRVCLTPTRAAIEATEEYRRVANLGRGGGVTNGWSFWKPKP